MGDGWEKYKAFWLGAGAEARAEIEKYAVVDARQGDASKLRYEYEEPTPDRALIVRLFPIREQKEGSCVAQFVASTESLMKKLAGTIKPKVAETTPKAEVVAVAFGAYECEPEILVNAATPSFALVLGSVLKEYELIAGDADARRLTRRETND